MGLVLAGSCLISACAIVGTRPPARDDERRGPRAIAALATPADISGTWLFAPGDDPSRAEPSFDDSAWTPLRVPGSWGRQGFDDVRGIAWYRLHVELAPAARPAREPLALRLGSIDSAYEVFVGGRRLGGIGTMPPAPRMEYDRYATYLLPGGAIGADGQLVIALRVWCAPGRRPGAAGPVAGPFQLGRLRDIAHREMSSELPELALVVAFVLSGLYHLRLHRLERSIPEYGTFAALSFAAAGYSLLRTQWKYVLWDDFAALKHVEHWLLYLTPPLLIQFLWVFLGERVGAGLRVLQAAFLTAGTVVLLWPSLTPAFALLPWLRGTVAGVGLLSLALLWRALRRRHPEAGAVAAGVVLLTAALAHDALADLGYLTTPRLGAFGFGGVVLGMSVSLANRFHRALEELRVLRRELEQRVEDRTRDLAHAHGEMERLAMFDALTGLPNRRAIQAQVEQELLRCARQGTAMVLALVDVDFFKAINDEHGHLAGDAALRHLAERFKGSLRAYDMIGRWGGEEFLVVLPDTAEAEAVATAERLRAAVADMPVPIGDASLRVTVSIGVGVAKEAAPRLEDVLRRADDALYRAKNAGRNRVEV